MAELSNEDQTRMAMAALFAALVKAMSVSDPQLPKRVSENLETMYRHGKDWPSQPIHMLETLRWAHEQIVLLSD